MKRLFFLILFLPVLVFGQSVSTSIKTDRIYSKIGRGISLYDTVFIKKGIAADSLENIQGIVCRNSSDGRLVYVSFAQFVDSIGGFSFSGDTIFIGGDTLILPNYWTLTGSDIQNNNAGKVILPKDSAYFSGIPDVATKVGRILHVNQYGKIEYVTPDVLGDTIARDGGGPWTQGSGVIYPTTLTDNVGMGTISPDKSLDVIGTVQSSETQYEYRKHKAFLSFASDDGKATDYTILYPLFESEGIKGTFNIITNSVGNSTYMTWAQILELQTDGHEIASHSASHKQLDTLTEVELLADFEEVKADFAAAGVQNVTTITYPYLVSSRTTREVAQKYFRAGFGNASNGSNDPNFNQFAIKRIALDTANIQKIKDSVLAAYNGNRYLTLYVHQVTASAADSIKKVIDYAQSLGMPIVTHTQAIDSIGNFIQAGDNFNLSQRGMKADTIWGNPVFPYQTKHIGRIFQDFGTDNIAIGEDALKVNQSEGRLNISIGRGSLQNNTTGDYNVGIGYIAAATNETASGLTAVGYGAMRLSTTWGTAFGYNALFNHSSGTLNTAFGYNAGANLTTTSSNSYFGDKAGQRVLGGLNTGIGQNALYGAATAAGAGNTGVGTQVLEDIDGGNYNTSIGYRGLANNTSGSNNTGIGTRALHTNTTASSSTAVGYYTLYTNNGAGNTAIGTESGYLNSSGNTNLFLGYRAGYNETGNSKFYVASDSTSSTAGMLSGSKLLLYGDQSNADKANHTLNIYAKTQIASAKAPAYTLDVAGTGFYSDDLTLDDNLAFVGAGQISTTGNGTMTLDVGTGKVDITGGLTMTDPAPWLDAFRQRPFYFTDMLVNGSTSYDPWLGNAVASATNSRTGSANHPGQLIIISSSNTNSGYSLLTRPDVIMLQGGEESTCIIYVDQLDNVTTRFGFHNSVNASAPTDGAYFQIGADSVLTGRTMNNTSESTTGTSYTLTDNTWYRLKIVVNVDATEVLYYLYNAAGTALWASSLTTNIPTARLTGHGIISTIEGTTASIAFLNVDYMDVYLGTLVR